MRIRSIEDHLLKRLELLLAEIIAPNFCGFADDW
jgi:hypothetical protein